MVNADYLLPLESAILHSLGLGQFEGDFVIAQAPRIEGSVEG